jgi:cellulose biosynthesis protein BcsQ
MAKVQLVIADQDVEYLQGFIQYIGASEFSEKLTVRCFSLEESLEQYLRKQEELDLLLVHPQLLPDSTSLKKISTVLLLSEQPYREDKQLHSTIYKYQPLNQLLTQVLSHFTDNNQSIFITNKGQKKTKILSVYSAVGGLGKTTLAVNLARELANLDHNVFYLNFEHISSSPLFFADTEEQTFSDILYYLEASPQQMLSKIESIKKHDPQTKIDYFSTLKNPREMLDISLEKSSLLINSLSDLGSYDLVIIDLESSTHDRILASFMYSDYIFCLVTDDVQCLTKTNMILKYFEERYPEFYSDFSSNIHFIMNKYTGKMVNSLEEFGIEVSAHLPYIPEWKSVGQISSVLNSAAFKKQVMNLHHSLLKDLRSKEQ